MPLHLVPVADPAQAVPLDKAIVFFGRHPDCDVVITSSRKVSRKHCCVAQIDQDYVVRDLGSMNGVSVNGTLIYEPTKISVGDEVAVGDVLFRVAQGGSRGGNGENGKGGPTNAKPSPPRHMISQDVPVAIAEEGRSFAVEGSATKQPSDTDEPIVLGKDDIVSDDESEFEIEVLD